MKAIKVLDFLLTPLILWSYYNIVFCVYNSILTDQFSDFECGRTIRFTVDLLILALLTFHLIDLLLGNRVWKGLYYNWRINSVLVGFFTILNFPNLLFWFRYYYYVDSWNYLLIGCMYCSLIILWASGLYSRDRQLIHN